MLDLFVVFMPHPPIILPEIGEGKKNSVPGTELFISINDKNTY